MSQACWQILFVVANSDVVAGWGEGVPGDVEPAGAGEELVGQIVSLEEGHEMLELLRIEGADVGGLADEVLRVADTTHEGVNARVAEAGVDQDGTHRLSGGLQ